MNPNKAVFTIDKKSSKVMYTMNDAHLL
jgi:hypothetical protein